MSKLKILFLFLLIMFSSGLPPEPEEQPPAKELTIEEIFGTSIKAEDVLKPQPSVEKKKKTEEGESENIIIKIEQPPPEKTLIEQRLASALALVKKGEIEKGRSALKDLITSFPNSDQAPYAMYLIALLDPNPEAMIENLSTLIRKYPHSYWAQQASLKLGELFYAKGKYAQALKQFLHYARNNPEGTYAIQSRINIALCLMRQGKYDKGVVLLKTMLLHSNDAKQSPEVYDALSECFIETDRFKEAQKILQFIMRKFPEYSQMPRIYMNYGLVAEMLNDTSTAIKMYEKVIDSYPESSQCELAIQRLKDLRTPLLLARSDESTTLTLPSLHSLK
ncbi:tetratricopeptide repeat protein [Candidatus Sumerlaeota bacterium]|nr:tetratricopeptide repeat protein [Candidatus Sumerlaeota bacterium]